MSRLSRSAEYSAAQLGIESNNQASDELIRVRPFKDDGGIDTAIEWFESVHPSHSDLSGKRSVPRAAEIVYDGEQISFRYLPCSDDFHWFLTRLRHKYPDSDVRRKRPTSYTSMRGITSPVVSGRSESTDGGQYVAATSKASAKTTHTRLSSAISWMMP
ncbi:hypothetical protein ACFFQF_32180 [Haladaptatus pallidirubidus]|uniref:hypothetical protein n=1 Tax=Haladaptatus pallidirubidus TaxID=1008152 RepID=UPI0035ECFBD9